MKNDRKLPSTKKTKTRQPVSTPAIVVSMVRPEAGVEFAAATRVLIADPTPAVILRAGVVAWASPALGLTVGASWSPPSDARGDEVALDGAPHVIWRLPRADSEGAELYRALFEVNAAAEVIHGVAHPDANIIFGAVIDDEMGDEVRVTVIAAGFERWDGQRERVRPERLSASEEGDLFPADDDLMGSEDDFDVPSFLK